MALGKLCLTDEPLAKKCVPLLVQQLKAAKAPAVRNNIMVALADLCVQYTALVDTHLPRLAACLSDPNELVRRQALALLANLLQKVRHVLQLKLSFIDLLPSSFLRQGFLLAR